MDITAVEDKTNVIPNLNVKLGGDKERHGESVREVPSDRDKPQLQNNVRENASTPVHATGQLPDSDSPHQNKIEKKFDDLEEEYNEHAHAETYVNSSLNERVQSPINELPLGKTPENNIDADNSKLLDNETSDIREQDSNSENRPGETEIDLNARPSKVRWNDDVQYFESEYIPSRTITPSDKSSRDFDQTENGDSDNDSVSKISGKPSATKQSETAKSGQHVEGQEQDNDSQTTETKLREIFAETKLPSPVKGDIVDIIEENEMADIQPRTPILDQSAKPEYQNSVTDVNNHQGNSGNVLEDVYDDDFDDIPSQTTKDEDIHNVLSKGRGMTPPLVDIADNKGDGVATASAEMMKEKDRYGTGNWNTETEQEQTTDKTDSNNNKDKVADKVLSVTPDNEETSQSGNVASNHMLHERISSMKRESNHKDKSLKKVHELTGRESPYETNTDDHERTFERYDAANPPLMASPEKEKKNERSESLDNNRTHSPATPKDELSSYRDQTFKRLDSDSNNGSAESDIYQHSSKPKEHLTNQDMEDIATDVSNGRSSFLKTSDISGKKHIAKETSSETSVEIHGSTYITEVRQDSFTNEEYDQITTDFKTYNDAYDVSLDDNDGDKLFKKEHRTESNKLSTANAADKDPAVQSMANENTGRGLGEIQGHSFTGRSLSLLGERNEFIEIQEKQPKYEEPMTKMGHNRMTDNKITHAKGKGGDNLSDEEAGDDGLLHDRTVAKRGKKATEEITSTSYTDFDDEKHDASKILSQSNEINKASLSTETYFTGNLPVLSEHEEAAQTQPAPLANYKQEGDSSCNEKMDRKEQVLEDKYGNSQPTVTESDQNDTENQLIFSVLKQYEKSGWDISNLQPKTKKQVHKTSSEGHAPQQHPEQTTKSGNFHDFVLEAKPATFVHKPEHENAMFPTLPETNAPDRSNLNMSIESLLSAGSNHSRPKSKTPPPPKQDTLEDANLTVNNINELTSKIMTQNYNAAPTAEALFDDLPQMKKISEYTESKNLNSVSGIPTYNLTEAEQTQSRNEYLGSDRNITGDVKSHETEKAAKSQGLIEREHSNVSGNSADGRQTLYASNKTLATTSKTKSENIGEKTEAKASFSPNTCHTYDTKTPNIPNEDIGSTAENDLKEMIETAKAAYHREREISQLGNLPTLKKKALSSSEKSSSITRFPRRRQRANSTASSTYKTDTSSVMTDDSLICSKCLEVDTDVASAGFCAICQQYLCNRCVNLHRQSKLTYDHVILQSYCVNELKALKYVKATGYCAECEHFLCSKCILMHKGFRKFRHHHIIQSTFVSKPKQSKDESGIDTSVNESLDSTGMKVQDTSLNTQDDKHMHEKRHLMDELNKPSPLNRFPFQSVSESLYPGPRKNLGKSYTSSPYWKYSSVQVPSLPYLVPPKSYKEPIQGLPGLPYIETHDPTLHNMPREAVINKRLKAVETRYGLSPRQISIKRLEKSRNQRLRQSYESVNLPKVGKNNSLTSRGHARSRSKQGQKGHMPKAAGLRTSKYTGDHSVTIPFPSVEDRTEILAMVVLFNGKILVADQNNNNIKVFNSQFECKSVLQFRNRLVDICLSNLCPTDIYAATGKHVYEITTIKGIDLKKKMRTEMKRIEGIACWKNGVAVVYVKSNLMWEILLLDYRGSVLSKLEVANPSSNEIQRESRCHVTSTKGGKYISIADTKNTCIICVDVLARSIEYETTVECPGISFLTADSSQNIFVSCKDRVMQLSRKGRVLGEAIKEGNGENFGCILYNKNNDCLYVQTDLDIVSVYQLL